ncbi:MAG TPA: nucleotidyltransferase domain-containing protein [Candidatus Nanoarchaeia archaeon]|nr:nucleotidyltransferase domain-containing protein [Candidatus Nanoarchaeia archaeon]
MLFEPIIGYKSTWRILSLLLETPRRLVSRSELFKFTKLGNAPLSRGLERLVRANILTPEKKGKKEFYYVNENNESALLLKQLWEKEQKSLRNLSYPLKIVLSEFLRSLNDSCLGLEKVILFGSQAKGTASVHSDIDLAVIFKRGLDQEILITKIIKKLEKQFKVQIQVHYFTSESFAAKNKLTEKINQEGIILTS